jgi:glycosyltransferase involved in cell wall biosynthesis
MSAAEIGSANQERNATRFPIVRDGRDPLVSVVIPAFNRAGTIVRCLKSVEAQTYPHWEAIVVDDGSSDNTSDLVLQMAATNPRIRFVRQAQNVGAQAARNTGVRAALGEWISFMDSDDEFLPESVERRLRLALDRQVAVVHSQAYVRDETGVRNYEVAPVQGHCYGKLLAAPGPMYQTLLVRREALERIGYLDNAIVAFQEWDTVIRLSKHFEFAFEPEPTFVYDCRGTETISKDFARAGRGYEQILRKHFGAILRRGGPRLVISHYGVAGDWYRNGGDLESARRCLRASRVWTFLDPSLLLDRLRLGLRRRLGF